MKKSSGITVESIILDHSFLVRATEEETMETGYDINKIDGALSGVFQTFDGKDLYPTKEEKAARLFFNLNTAHAFVDGNKRVAVYQMIKFLKRAGINLNATEKQLEELAYKTISEKDFQAVVQWIREHKVDSKQNF